MMWKGKGGCKRGGLIMWKLKGWMDKGEHYQVEIKGLDRKGGIMICNLKRRINK